MYFWPRLVYRAAALAFGLSGSVAATERVLLPDPLAHAVTSKAREAAMIIRSSCIGYALLDLVAKFRLSARAVHDLSLELSAGGIDVVAARAADHGQHAGVEQDFLEFADGG